MTDVSHKKTLYEILGVEPDANLVDIQIAHEGLIAAEGALDQAERVALKEAYRILADARRRAAYDKSLRQRALPPAVEVVEEDDAPSGRSKTPWVISAMVVLLLAGGWWFTKSPGKPASSPAVTVARAASAPSSEPEAALPAASSATVATEWAPDKLLLGTWHCKGPLTGKGLDLSFASDGAYSGQVDGQLLRGDYTVNGAALTFRDPEQSNGFAIEELSPQRLVIHRGEGKRLSCNR